MYFMLMNLGVGISFLIVLLIITSIFFSKKTLSNYTNKMFKILIITTIIGLLIEISIYYIILCTSIENMFIYEVLIKLLYVYYIFWMYYFVLYNYSVFIGIKENDSKFQKFEILISIFYIISLILSFVLPINIEINDIYIYPYGIGTLMQYFIVSIGFMIIIGCVLKNINKLKDMEAIPVIACFILGILSSIVQYYHHEFMFIVPSQAIAIIFMYFTIENPDIKTIKELTYSKEMLEKANNATMNSLNNLSLSTTNSLSKLLSLSNKKVDKSNVEEVIDETDNMKKIAVELVDQINGIIDLSKIESSKYELVKNNYNLYELVVQIRDLFNSKLGNKKIKIKDNIKEDMPNVLYGDSEKIKQAVIYLFNSLITNYNISNMEYRVFTLKVRSLCRLKISLILDYKEIEEYLENKNGKQIINLKGLDYKILEKLITLLHGSYDVIISNNKVAFTISIDQKDVLEYNNINNIKEEKRSKIDIFNASDKRILIVDDNRNKIKEIVRMLTPYNIDVSVAHDYREYNDLLYSNKTWDLILLDDMMPDSKKFEYLDYNHLNNQEFERIEKIAGYKISVVVMLTPNKIGIEKRYENAKIDYILKPIDEVKLNKILKKYLLNNK